MLDSANVFLFEEHSSTLPVWWSREVEARTVVYLDAHLDLQKTSPESLAALEACDDIEAVRRLEAPSHLDPSPRYSYGIENFLYAAHELGLIERLVWVSPPHIPRRYSPALLAYMQQMDGIEFSELTGFREQGGNVLRGSLLGLDITICDFDELESIGIDNGYSLDIDIDYFVEVPADRLWTDPARVIESITAQLGEPDLATISRAVGSGFTPVAFRFVADYIHSQLTGKTRDFDYYQRLYSAILDLDENRIAEGSAACRQLLDDRPDLPAAYYIAALCTGDPARKKQLLEESCRLDSSYCFDLAREAIGLLHRKKPAKEGLLGQFLATLETLDLPHQKREQAEIALARVLAASGDPGKAQILLERQTGDFANHDDVLLAIASSRLSDADKYADTRRMFELVCQREKNATLATICLGDLELAQRNPEAALDHYARAHDRAPAWMLPLERLLTCYRDLGLHEKAARTREEIDNRKARLEELVARSAGNTGIGSR